MSDDSNTFPKKWNKLLTPEFKDIADAASAEDLKATLVTCNTNIYNIEKEKEADHKLNGAKELIKDLSAPYSEAKKYQQAKIQYALFLLEAKGEDLGDIEKE